MDSMLIEVALGIVLIYLVMSLSVTSLNEVFLGLLNLRGRELRSWLLEIFDTEAGVILNDPLLRTLSRKGTLPSYIPSTLLSEAVATRMHDVVAVAADLRSQLNNGQKTYQAFRIELETAIEKSSFPLNDYAIGILERADGTGKDFRRNVEERIAHHYDDVMDRASGSFARKMKRNSAVIAAILVVFANADTLRIANQLTADQSMRTAIAEAAESYSDALGDPGAYGDSDLVLANTIASFPLGWSCPNDHESIGWPNAACVLDGSQEMTTAGAFGIGFGWLLTTLAIMLGAPFWFGVLQRVSNIRSAGVKPKSRTDTNA